MIRNIAREGGAGGMRGEMDLDDGSAEPHRAPKAMLDLENLAFDQGAHLMSNKTAFEHMPQVRGSARVIAM